MRAGRDFMKLFFAAACVTLGACGLPQLTGGTSTSENGRLIGRVVDQRGAPAGGVRVLLLPAAYDPVKDGAAAIADTTDSLGNYAFQETGEGDCSLMALAADRRTSGMVRGIQGRHRIDTVTTDTLRPPGFAKVALPAGVNLAAGYVYIPGTFAFAFLENSAGFVVLDSIPAGETVNVAYSTTAASSVIVLRYGVAIKSLDTAAVLNPGWSYSRKVTLNTSASGANITGDVVGFPVLVRLTADNFDFTQAKSEGADLRFTKSDNTFLAHEIERWDPVTGLAEAWVKVDTIHGNDSAQSLVMYWGNAGAVNTSSGAAVFDTAAGFAGVWHLGRPVGSSVPDATANGNNGTALATTTVGGADGTAQMFDGKSSLVRVSGPAGDKLNFPENGTFTVSAWVKASALDGLFHGIVYKSNFQYGLQIKPENQWEFLNYTDQSRWEMSRSPAAAGSWHALVGERSGAKQYLYVDGACVDSSITVAASNLVRAYDQPLEIGHCPDGGDDPDRYFNGVIDEVRVEKTTRNADWIKLCYMNQKEQDALVMW